jgi:hypothetical protein
VIILFCFVPPDQGERGGMAGLHHGLVRTAPDFSNLLIQLRLVMLYLFEIRLNDLAPGFGSGQFTSLSGNLGSSLPLPIGLYLVA